jgi:hypothetical protein
MNVQVDMDVDNIKLNLDIYRIAYYINMDPSSIEDSFNRLSVSPTKEVGRRQAKELSHLSNTNKDWSNELIEINDLMKWVLSYILENTNENICISGSCCRLLYSDTFEMIRKQDDIIIERDIDIICKNGCIGDVLNILYRLGTVTTSNTHNAQYSSLRHRNINYISIAILEINSTKYKDNIDVYGYTNVVTSLLRHFGCKSLKIKFDIVELLKYKSDNLSDVDEISPDIEVQIENWPRSDISRGYIMRIVNNSAQLIEIKQKKFVMKQNSLVSLIESIKLHSRIETQQTSTVDQYKYVFDVDKSIMDDSIFGEQKRKGLLNNNITLCNFNLPYVFKYYTVDTLSKVFNDYLRKIKKSHPYILNDIFSTLVDKSISIKEVTMLHANLLEPCCICTEESLPSKKRIILPCGHIFCLKCISKLTIAYSQMILNRVNHIPDDDETSPDSACCPCCRARFIDNIDMTKLSYQRSLLRMVDINITSNMFPILKFRNV